MNLDQQSAGAAIQSAHSEPGSAVASDAILNVSGPQDLKPLAVMPEVLQPGEIYRLVRGVYAGYNHAPEYDEGNFVHVKILSGPDKFGLYNCTTFGDDGRHIGPGGGWTKEHEDKGLHFVRSQLEPIA